MAKASWLNVTPTSGSGNGRVNVSSTVENTGRNARTTTLTFTAANVDDVVRNVSQAGKPEYVEIAESAASDKNGKPVTISGRSNSSKLTFSLGSGTLLVDLPPTYVANSTLISNGATLTGDPGASAEYDFSITIFVPANTGTTSLTRQIIVTAADGKQDTCTLTLAAGDAYLRVAVGTIELDYLGTAVSVEVESNTSWSIK